MSSHDVYVYLNTKYQYYLELRDTLLKKDHVQVLLHKLRKEHDNIFLNILSSEYTFPYNSKFYSGTNVDY